MSGSGNKINYNLRPAKSVERRMVFDVAREVFKDYNVDNCRYIGFGSFYFTDYKIAHRELGIANLLSFEKRGKDFIRAVKNAPYKCINVRQGASTQLLPTLTWPNSNRDFVWMDYDGGLTKEMLLDCELIISRMAPGGIYLMTCRRGLEHFDGPEGIREVLGDVVPLGVDTNDFAMDDLSDLKLIRRIFTTQLQEAVSNRNLSLAAVDHLVFNQLFFFYYQDGTPMVSFGGMLDLASNPSLSNRLNNRQFFFMSPSDVPYVIEVPSLTYKEIHDLNSKLPCAREQDILSDADLSYIPDDAKLQYSRLYRYLPTYVDAIH